MALRIVSPDTFLRAIDGARSVELTASLLPARGDEGILAVLARAADRGAHVYVRLPPDPYDLPGADRIARMNRLAVTELRAHGADAALADEAPCAPLHMKAAIVDGQLFLDDRNWTPSGRDTIVTTRSSSDIAAVASAMRGKPISDGHLATSKRAAQSLESAVIADACHGPIALESESFGTGVVCAALLERAKAGDSVRIIVASRDLRENVKETKVLERLIAAGAQVRVERDDRNEKLCVAGDAAWVGSANATAGFPATIDWGTRTRAAPIVDALRTRFEENWRAGTAVS